MTLREALKGLIEGVVRDSQEKGISGYTSARLTDAKNALEETPKFGKFYDLANKIEKRIAIARVGMGDNVAVMQYQGRNDESALVIEALRTVDMLRQGIRDIAQACVDGRVCDDVAWFTAIPAETLFDKCENLLDEDLPREPTPEKKTT